MISEKDQKRSGAGEVCGCVEMGDDPGGDDGRGVWLGSDMLTVDVPVDIEACCDIG